MKPSLKEVQAPGHPDPGSQAREYREIQAQMKRRGLWLTMPEPLESQYCRSHDAMAAAAFASTISWALGLYLLLGAVVLLLLGTENLGIWPISYSIFLLFILAGWLMSFTRIVHRHYQVSVAALTACAVFFAVLHPSLLDHPHLRALVHQGTVFVVVLVYLGFYLRFRYAAMAGTLAGLMAYPVMVLFELPVDWQMSAATFLGGGGLGALLRFRDEHRNRKFFLQARLLEVDNERIQQLADELERLSFLDGLTGLANRRYFDRMFEKAWKTAQRELHPISLVMLDVDHFKRYNDHYGHQQGDHCLREIARSISFITARPQDLSARWGGEEFILLFPRTESMAARHLAGRILEKVRSLNLPHEVSDCSDSVTVSAGVATVIPSPDLRMEDLLEAADRALYSAKNNGRNRWVSAEDVRQEYRRTAF